MSKFYIGQPVVCINGKPSKSAKHLYPGIVWPQTGKVYRIRAIYSPMRTQISRYKTADLVFVLLHGLNNRKITWPNGMNAEAAFWEERFEAATDIDSLRDIADNVRKYMGSDGPRVDKKVKRRQKEKA